MENNIENQDVTPSRVLSLEILQKIEKWRGFADEVVNSVLRKHNLDPRDKHLITELVQGCLRWRIQLDYVIRNLSHLALNKIEPEILNILRLGTYQLLFTDRIPISAAVNESVKLTRKRGHAGSIAFVNALLRKISKEGTNILKKPLNDPVHEISLRTAHPEWLVRKWIKRFGSEKARELLELNNEIPAMCIRVNTLKTNKETIWKILEDEELNISEGKLVSESLVISGRTIPPDHHLLNEGMIHIQDESSQFVATILNPAPGDSILDVCAAPGTKTTQIAAMMNNRGMLLAWDTNPLRLRELKENCIRMGVTIANIEHHDATHYDPRYTGRFDKILVDAPCSAIGVIRRHPEIKWSRRENDFGRFTHLQLKLLSVCSKYLKKNAVLIYSVCSTEPEEGENIIETFLNENNNLQLTQTLVKNQILLNNVEMHNGWARTYPPHLDGFFVAKIQRIK